MTTLTLTTLTPAPIAACHGNNVGVQRTTTTTATTSMTMTTETTTMMTTTTTMMTAGRFEPNRARLNLEAEILTETRDILGRDIDAMEIVQAIPAASIDDLPERPGEFRAWLPKLNIAVAVRLRS